MNPSWIRVLRYFNYKHLPEHLQKRSKPFHSLAHELASWDEEVSDPAEMTVALRKLLEAKDAAVRSVLQPMSDTES